MDLEYLKSLGFTEYKFSPENDIKICYEIEFPSINRAVTYYVFYNGLKELCYHKYEEGDVIERGFKDYKIKSLIDFLKHKNQQVEEILKTEFTF
ncbi:hypothetical protein IF125_11540 [Empedobacter stercoris]|uniref:hypothetical protein n=1 Tax=Empedobacter stercoris TaxID=1628248 RepID=UPI001CE169EB|nr:hypothetical protein [Empedobacter stercoris]MCA4782878.1 hypothetical protein [Empedobacter stercoris]